MAVVIVFFIPTVRQDTMNNDLIPWNIDHKMNVYINEVSYAFQGHVALEKINLILYPGQVTYVLGPNGAGKSTLVNCICGVYGGCSGSIMIPEGKSMGALLNQPFVYSSLKVRDNIRILLRYNQVEYNDYHHMINKYLEMDELLPRPFKKLSGGQKQRVLLFLSIINDPDIILLDEPFNGLDPFYTEKLIALILRLKESGRVILINDHIISHTLRLADQIAFLIHHQVIWTMQAGALGDGLYFHSLADPERNREIARPFSDCVSTAPMNGLGSSRRIDNLTDLYTTAIEYGRPQIK